MTLNPEEVDAAAYDWLSEKNVYAITKYIEDSMSATTINNSKNNSKNKEIITSEIIYYWMVASTIPFECQYWHLNRLLTLINVYSIKTADPKKRNKSEILSSNAALNKARREQYNTKG